MGQKTSFGRIEVICQEPFIERLFFHRSGRPHQHKEYEVFITIKGTGKVIKGELEISVSPGSIVIIPPNTDHWMIPDEGQVLEGFLYYSEKQPKAD